MFRACIVLDAAIVSSLHARPREAYLLLVGQLDLAGPLGAELGPVVCDRGIPTVSLGLGCLFLDFFPDWLLLIRGVLMIPLVEVFASRLNISEAD